MIKRIFRKLLPTLRMEAGCAVSVIAAFLFFQYGGPREVPREMGALWQAGKTGQWIFTAALLVVGLGALLLPLVSCTIGTSLHRRFAALSLAFSVFVLVCAEGWSASHAFSTFFDGPRIYGVPWGGLFGVVAVLELGILIYGGVAALDDRPLLLTLIGTRDVDPILMAINLGVVALSFVLFRFWVDIHPAEASLLALHLIFAITLLRAPSVPETRAEV